MPIQVNLPNGQIGSFPDGMDHSEIESIIQKQFPPQGTLQTLGNYAGEFNNAFESLGKGALQGAEHAGASIANLPLQGINKLAGSNLEAPYIDLEKGIRQDPLSRLLFKGGEIGGQMIPGIGLTGKLASLLGKPKLIKDILAGAASGFATGGSDENDTESRLISSALQGLLPGASGLRNKNIANKIIGQKEKLSQEFSREYNKFFKNQGIGETPIEIPKSLEKLENAKAFKKVSSGNKDYLSGYESFKENPTLENAHTAQSDLGKLVRHLENKVSLSKMKGKSIPSGSSKTIRLADDLRENIKQGMRDTLKKSGNNKEWEDYAKITKKYREEMVPYLHPSISKYEAGKIRSGKLIKEISKDEAFTKPGGAYKDIPGLPTKRMLHGSPLGDALHKALIGGAFGLGATTMYNLGAPGIGNLLSKFAD